MKLSEFPDEDVVLGMRVFHHDRRGVVTNVDPDPDRGLDITISWDDGGEIVEWKSKLNVTVDVTS